MELGKCYWVRQISSLINVLRTSLQYRYYISGDLIRTNYLQYVSAVVFYLGTWMKVGFFVFVFLMHSLLCYSTNLHKIVKYHSARTSIYGGVLWNDNKRFCKGMISPVQRFNGRHPIQTRLQTCLHSDWLTTRAKLILLEWDAVYQVKMPNGTRLDDSSWCLLRKSWVKQQGKHETRQWRGKRTL